MMMRRRRTDGVRRGLLCLLALLMSVAVWAQNPPYRPNLVWHLAATYTMYPQAFTEDGEYLLTVGIPSSEGGLVMVYQVSALLNSSTPKGHALVSYDYAADGYFDFTDRDENGNEYVVRLYGNQIQMWRWVRNASAFRGGYLEKPKTWTVSGWSSSEVLVLRGERTDRRFNRLAVSGDGSGNLRIVLLNYNAASQAPVLVAGAHGAAITALAYDPATRRLISGGQDGLIRIWQVGLAADGTPSLTPLQTLAAHWSAVRGLQLAQVGSSRYLLSVSLDGHLLGWSWPNPSPAPLWSQTIEAGSNDLLRAPAFLARVPYGDFQWGMLFHSRGWHYTVPLDVVLIDPATGRKHYRFTGYRVPVNLYTRSGPVIVSPSIGGVRYFAGLSAVGEFYTGSGGTYFAGLWPVRLDTTRAVGSSASFSVTAMDSLVSSGTRYLAVGYANGEIRVYRNTGSGWTLWDSSTTLHPNKQVVGVRLILQSGGVFTLSADMEGQVVVAQHTGSVTLKASVASGLTSAASMALGADGTSALVAVGGQKDGAPRVETLRLTWSGTTPALVAQSGFTVSGESGSVSAVAFVAVPSADLVVATGRRVSRWNYTAGTNAYGRSLNYVDGAFASLSIAGGNLWIDSGSFTPQVYDVNSGARLWAARPDPPTSWWASSGPVLALSGEQAVWGLVQRLTSQDSEYFVARGRGWSRPSVANNELAEGWQAHLPEAVSAIARDPSNPDVFYVGCLDGSIQQVQLPDYTPVSLAGYAGLSGQFEIVQNRVAAFLTSYPPAFFAWGGSGAGIRHAATLNLTNGVPIASSMVCNADGTGCAPQDVGISALMRVSPSGNVLYGYEVRNNRLTGWNGATMAQLFNTTNFPEHWWPIGVDDSRVALLYNEYIGSYTIGTTTYHRYRPRMRIIKWTPTLTVEADRPFNENTEFGFIMTNQNSHRGYLLGMRWDMSADRRFAAVYGLHHYDPNTPGVRRRRILLLYRPNPSDWTTWNFADLLEEGTDFPSGVYPTLIRFHPTASRVLYVGLSNGRLRLYRLNALGQITNRTSPDEFVPTLGTLGAVSVLDVADFVQNGYHYSLMVFGGPEGLSVWVGFVCQPGWINEVHFYYTDIAFFPSVGMGYVQVDQPNPSQPPYLVYSNGLVMSAAKLDNLPELPCPEDVNRDGEVDDSDVLEVLFAFGGEGYNRADVNCDGLVDDSDLLLVLFAFGSSC
jgi:WD40 repeat protein